MMKVRRCEEVVSGNGHHYLFSGTFGNIEKASFVVGDPSQIFADLSEGRMPPTTIKSVIACTMVTMDKVPVDELDVDALAERFLDDFGLQDCSLLARQLIGHALIGDVKKKQIESDQAVKGMFRKLRLSLLIPSARAGWLWVGLLAALSMLAVMTFK